MVTLSLDYTQSNDAKRIILTDGTSDWGGPNPAVSGIVVLTNTTAGKYHLTLETTITLSTGEEVECDDIDLRSTFSSEFVKTGGMIYELTLSTLLESGNSIATSNGTFPDGVYKFTYKLAAADTNVVQTSIEYLFLVDGNVRNEIYKNLSEISEVYNCKVFNADDQQYKDIIKDLFNYTYFQGMLSNPSISEKEDKIAILNTLERLLNE